VGVFGKLANLAHNWLPWQRPSSKMNSKLIKPFHTSTNHENFVTLRPVYSQMMWLEVGPLKVNGQNIRKTYCTQEGQLGGLD